MTNLYQSPDELFDVLDADGTPTGETKRRADVHRDGDWHRSIHVWVWRASPYGGTLLFNQRGLHKDTWPGLLDATVGGHLAAGESVADAVREVKEEIGVTVTLDDLIYLGTRARASENHTPGIIDREFQEVYALEDPRPLQEFRPNPGELEALVEGEIAALTPIVNWRGGTATAWRLDATTREVSKMSISAEDLVMSPGDPYMAWVVEAILALAPGERES